MRVVFCITFIFLSSTFCKAQELFPQVDPASLIPKNVFGVRVFNQGFNEVNQFRSLQSYRFMYGISSKWMVSQSFNFSNHHGRTFPSNFIRNDGTIGYHTHGVTKGIKYPYLFENMAISIKYRFLRIDGDKRHFRMAAYLDLAGGNSAHDEAEPSLMGDNSGIGAGLTATKLHKRFAISGSIGGVLPLAYNYKQDGSSVKVQYGKALNYSLSMGLLCLPIKYKNFNQTNVNLYAEFIGKAYQGASIFNNGKEILIASVPALEKGNYIEFRPAIQFIINSNLRIDLSMGKPIVSHSYVTTSTAYYFTIQRYFYFKK
jgi:hypothetical protein